MALAAGQSLNEVTSRPTDALAANSYRSALRITSLFVRLDGALSDAVSDARLCPAGREVYCTLLVSTYAERDLLRDDDGVGTQGLPKLSESTARKAVLVYGLFGAVLTYGLLLGRRYIDPGSGSFAIQIIIAAVLGGLLTTRLWLRHMFWRVFGRRRRTESDSQPSGEEAER